MILVDCYAKKTTYYRPPFFFIRPHFLEKINQNTTMRFLFHCLLLTHSNIGNEICQLNHAGASPSSQTVIDRVVEHMELEEAIGGYAAAQEASRELAQVYSKAASLINAKDNEIALVESATVAWTRAFYAMVEKQMKTKRGNANVIIISEAEYAANVVAASQWARDRNWTLLTIPSSLSPKGESTGMVDLRTLDKILSGNYVYKDHAELSICLLYTSPSPRDRQKSRMPSSA